MQIRPDLAAAETLVFCVVDVPQHGLDHEEAEDHQADYGVIARCFVCELFLSVRGFLFLSFAAPKFFL